MPSQGASSETITFRAAETGDVAAVNAIARRAYEKYVARIGREPAPMVANFTAHVVDGETTVAERRGVIVGYLIAYPREADYFVENVAVDPGHSGRGVGGALMDRAEADARAAGKSLVRLYTNVRMEENFPFYDALGYLKTHETVEDGFHRAYFEKRLEDT